jgi:CheY-like chemotaxis protein
MRKRRVIIHDDQKIILNVLGSYFAMRGYEVVTFESPAVCAVSGEDSITCEKLPACADIIISDFMMPVMNGAEMFRAQSRRGCRVPVKNKAVMSGCGDDSRLQLMQEAGYRIFAKPFDLKLISEWLDGREPEMDLSQPLCMPRREHRQQISKEVTCLLLPHALKLRGIATNISPSGLCVKINTPVTEEQKVSVLFGSTGDYRPASVRWKRKIEERHYLAGLLFM